MAVFFAAALFVFIGMTGLAVDYGFAALERRVLQNAVDAAAVTGANNLARGASPASDVTTIASRNNIALSTAVVCEYVDNSNAVTGPCSSTPSGTTSGVKVTATNDRATYFMRVLGVPTVTVSATSMARVFALSSASAPSFDAWGSFFIVCGIDTTRATPKANGNGYDYDEFSILKSTGITFDGSGNPTYTGPWPSASAEWPLNDVQSPVGMKFVIHDENDVAKCGIGDSGFKGLNATSGGPIQVPSPLGGSWTPTVLIAETGARSGPSTEAVRTYNGCKASSSSSGEDLNNCVLIIPVFTSVVPAPNDKVGGDYRVQAVRWLPFLIEAQVKNGNVNTHFGTLLDTTQVVFDSTMNSLIAPWTKNGKATYTTARTVQ